MSLPDASTVLEARAGWAVCCCARPSPPSHIPDLPSPSHSALTYIMHGRPISSLLFSNLSVWDVLKKKPLAVASKAHGDQWVTAVSALRYGDIVASGKRSADGIILLAHGPFASGRFTCRGGLLLPVGVRLPDRKALVSHIAGGASPVCATQAHVMD